MNLNILLVDDNGPLRKFLALLLARESMHVTMVSDGQQAIERLSHARYPFDLVISEVDLPGVDGWDLLAWVREHDETLPVVLMSSGQPRSFAYLARAAGAYSAIPKPFYHGCLHELLGSIAELSDRASELPRFHYPHRFAA